MKTCNAKDQDGEPCPNLVDEGQEYCLYHLASQVTKEKKILINVLITLGTIISVTRIVPVGKSVIGKFGKFVLSKKL
jgi:hypothetical protein